MRIAAYIALCLLPKLPNCFDRGAQKAQMFLQAWHALRQLCRPGARRPGHSGHECDDRAEQQRNQKKGAEHSRYVKAFQQPQGWLQ